MANVTEIYTLTTQAAYLSDGVRDALEGLLRNLPPALKRSDNIAFYSNASISTAPIDIDTGAGSRPLAVVVESRGSAGYLRLYNEDGSASVTGSDEIAGDIIVPVPSTTGEITAISIFGNGFATWWGAGLVAAASASKPGANARTVMTNMPRVYLLYVNA